MRKLLIKMSVSVDLFVGGPNGEIDWLFPTTDAAATDWTLSVIWQAGLHIMGSSKTTTALKNAGQMMKERNLSFSETAAMESWNEALVLTGDLADEVGKLKAQPGKDIIAHGGASFCQSLVATGLVDEYHLLIHPVVLGKGLPLFSAVPGRVGLKLIEAKAFPAGAVAHSYSAA